MEVLNVLALGCYRTIYIYNKTSSYNKKALNQFFEISYDYTKQMVLPISLNKESGARRC